MRNKEFDKLLKDKIANNNLKNTQADWDVFSELLKNSEGFEDMNFDKSIKSKVNKHSDNVNPNHWKSLKNRLAKEEFLRRRIFVVKSIELMALLFLFINYQNYENAKFQNTPFVFKFDEKKSESTTFGKVKDIIAKAIIASPSAIISVNQLNNIIENTFETQTQESSIPVVLNDEEIILENKFRNDFSEEFKNSRSIDVNLSSIESLELKNFSVNHSSIKPEMKLTNNFLALTKPLFKEREKFISGFVSSGIGITKSSFDRVYNLKAYEAYDNQYSVGFLIGKKKNNIEYSTGLKVTRRANEPAKVVETYGDFLNNYYEISLNKITYNIVEVPLNLKYFFDNKGNTNYYVKAGVNSNFAMHNTYTITKKPKNSSSNSLTTTLSISDGEEIDQKASRSKLKQKEFSPGILNGGTLADNYFMTVSLELGMERKLNKNNTLFLGAEYSKYYMIDGIGPNKEKLNNLALNVGLKHYIN